MHPDEHRQVKALTKLAFVGVAWLMVGLWRAPAVGSNVAFSPVECPSAVMIAGNLVCGQRRPATLAEVCPGAPRRPIRPGDSLVPKIICNNNNPTRGQPGWRRMPPDDLAALALPVNLNEAGADELASFPGIGPALAGRIIEARQQRAFATVAELDDVRGIGPRILERLRSRAIVSWPHRASLRKIP